MCYFNLQIRLLQLFIVVLSCLHRAPALIPDVIVYNQFPIYQVKNEGYLKNRPSSLLIFGTERPSDLEQVLFRRDPDTGLGTSLPEPSVVRMVEPFSTSSEYSKVALFLPISDGFAINTGSYTVSLRQQQVEITALKLPDQAPLKPVEFTKRAHVDESVTLEVRVDTAFYNYTAPIIWRHNGRLMPWWNSQHQTIHSVLKSDEGVYEFYQSESDRKAGKIGLFRLIVSNCAPLVWGKACTEHCPICENGGVCDELLGECICPPGFKGKYCENACEESWFDAGCTSRCGSPDEFGGRSCSSYQFCLQDPYGCSCSSGFYGIHCNDECEKGYFGAGCALKCHCAGDKPCNPVTGLCPNGCEFGYSGDSCQTNDIRAQPLAFYNTRTNPGQPSEFICALQVSKKPSEIDCTIQAPDGTVGYATGTSFLGRNYPYKWSFYVSQTQLGSYNCIFKGQLMSSVEIKFFALPRLRDAPETEQVGSSFVRLKWQAWTRFYDYGDGPIKEYKLFAARNQQMPSHVGTVLHKDDKKEYSFNVTGLGAFTNYSFFIRTSREGLEGTGQPGLGIRTVTKCDERSLSVGNVETLATHANRILFRWQPAPCANSLSTVSKYQYQFSRSSNFKDDMRSGYELGTTHSEEQLQPFTQYFFRVRPLLVSGSHGVWSGVLNAQTSESKASAPLDFQILCSDLNSITVGWRPPQYARGLIDQYEIKYDKSFNSAMDSATVYKTNLYSMELPGWSESSAKYVTQEVKRTTLQNFELKIDKLLPNTTYYFRVRAKNGFGAGDWSNDIVGRSEFAICHSNAAFTLPAPASANLAVIAAIFVGVILTITIIVAAAIGYFGINCSPNNYDKDPRNNMIYTRGTLAGGVSRNHPGGLNHDQIEIMEQTYLTNPECGLRLSNYHQETDSLINEAISIQSRNYSSGTLPLPGSTSRNGNLSSSAIPKSGSASGYASMRVHHSPGRVTRVPVGPGSMDLPDFFERKAPDGNENLTDGFATSRRGDKKLSFADQVSVRNGDKNFDSSQHDESNASSIKSDVMDGHPGSGRLQMSPQRSPSGSMQGMTLDFAGSRPSSVTPPLFKQNTLQAQISADSTCLIVTPADTPTTPVRYAPPLVLNNNTIRAMENKQRSFDSQTFYRAK